MLEYSVLSHCFFNAFIVSSQGQQLSLIAEVAEGQTIGLGLGASEMNMRLDHEEPIKSNVEDDDDVSLIRLITF